jgi:hypothetical protein
MVDFAGTKYHWVDEQTGERISSEVFVATLPSFHNILQALNLIPII